ncbi:cyclophilin-like fold protein [[Eubacterium] cellulosolvens]
MPQKIRIHTNSTGYVEAEINEDKNPETAKALIDALPFESRVSRWGDEVYFDIPVNATEENSQIEVEVGELAFWPSGSCFCIFFGRTPSSSGDKPAAASPVNVFGKVLGDATIFKDTKSGEIIRVEKA